MESVAAQTKFPLQKICENYLISPDLVYKFRRLKGLKIFYLGNKPFIRPSDLEACMEEETEALKEEKRQRSSKKNKPHQLL